MTTPVGSVMPVTITVFGPDGVTLVDPTSAQIVVTLPTQVTQAYTWPTNTAPALALTRLSVGKFQALHTVTVKGLHGYIGSAVNPAAVFGPDSFYGADPSLIPVVSLADARTQLRSQSTATDTQVLGWAVAATRMAEQYTHKIWSTRTFSEKHTGGTSTLSLFNLPVQSITSVTENNTVLATTGAYVLDDYGIVWRGNQQGYGTSLSGQLWISDQAPIVVTYVAGPNNGVVPENIRLGVLEMIQHLAIPTRGGSGRPAQSGDTVWAPGVTFPMPRRVAGFWASSKGAGI